MWLEGEWSKIELKTPEVLEVIHSPELRREKELQVGLVGIWKSDSDSAVKDDKDERLSSHADRKEVSVGWLGSEVEPL